MNKFDKVQDRLRAARGNWELVEGESEEVGTLQKEPHLCVEILGAGTQNLSLKYRESPQNPHPTAMSRISSGAVIISIFLAGGLGAYRMDVFFFPIWFASWMARLIIVNEMGHWGSAG